jgi:putative molybdopterin biosynthesis protein
MAREQEQFLEVLDRDVAERRWWAWLRPDVLGSEPVALAAALGRVLAADVVAAVDVPPFDRANVDGFAVQAQDTFGAAEESPRVLAISSEEVTTGVIPRLAVEPGSATSIATGGVVPRGADAVVMIEHAHIAGDRLHVVRPVAPGSGITFAGTDIARGERIIRKGALLSARETGTLAAIGMGRVGVVRKPRVAIISTGDELVAPGEPLWPAAIHDANATLIAHAVRELGAEPIPLGIVADQELALAEAVARGLAAGDLLILSGGTSKGAGDLSYRVLARRQPGILVHGVALKPGKPICLGAVGRVPVVILPGFPTSAIFTFHEFVAPLIRVMGGHRADKPVTTPATMPFRYNSEIGRTEYLLVNLVQGPGGLSAYPLGKGAGSVTTFSQADGFLVIPRAQEFVEAGETVDVVSLGRGVAPADLVVVGSHCTGIDLLLGILNERGFSSKTIWMGSQGGVTAAARGECDLAGIHLLDPETNEYNRAFVPSGATLVRGYGRMQGIGYRAGDRRFDRKSPVEIADVVCRDQGCYMVNRNRGSGTRILIDRLLAGLRPRGYAVEARSHNAVAAALEQGRADWGVLIQPVAAAYGLGFVPLSAEQFDFLVPDHRLNRPALRAFRELLDDRETRRLLVKAGFKLDEGTG